MILCFFSVSGLLVYMMVYITMQIRYGLIIQYICFCNQLSLYNHIMNEDKLAVLVILFYI